MQYGLGLVCLVILVTIYFRALSTPVEWSPSRRGGIFVCHSPATLRTQVRIRVKAIVKWLSKLTIF